jgi:hypothetical protein
MSDPAESKGQMLSKSGKRSKSPFGSMSSKKTLRTSVDPTHRPKLALTPEQFTIIDNLNDVGFTKYPVYIHNHRHTHAAIIVRSPKDGFYEGKIVMKHWLDQEFVI